MYSFIVGSIRVPFSSAMMTVSRDISHHDWRDDEGVYARQDIHTLQGLGSATVKGLNGMRREMGPHAVQVLNPRVFTETEPALHLARSGGSTAEEILSVMTSTDYDWGKLVEINWTALEYVPGGFFYYLLPLDHPVVDLAGLKLDWPSIAITSV